MCSRRTAASLLGAALMTAFLGAPPSTAAPSTSRGQISVAQVLEMLDKAPTENTARQVLTAYLAAVGETAKILVSAGDGANLGGCKSRLSLSDAHARQALEAAGGRESLVETPATPLIVRDMFGRAGCGRGR